MTLNQVPYRNTDLQAAGSIVISARHSISDVFVTGPVLHKTTQTDLSKCSSSDILFTASPVVYSRADDQLTRLHCSLSVGTYT